MDSGAEAVELVGRIGVGKSKPGVAISSVAAGDENPDGVEACSVANRSAPGVEGGLKRPHPRMKRNATTIHSRVSLFMV